MSAAATGTELPGDPEALRTAAWSLAAGADQLDQLTSALRRVPAGLAGEDWCGPASEAFTDAIGQRASRLQATAARLRGGAGVLHQLAARLEHAQAQAGQAARLHADAASLATQGPPGSRTLAQEAHDLRARAGALLSAAWQDVTSAALQAAAELEALAADAGVSRYGTAHPATRTARLPSVPGFGPELGQLQVAGFIPRGGSAFRYRSDGRDFSPGTVDPAESHRFYLLLDFTTGMATIRVYPTCNTSGQCADPLPLTLEGGRDWLLGSPNDNEFRFTVDAQGALLVHYEVGHSMGRGWSWRRATRPAAEGTLRITRDASGRLHVEPLDDTDAFPSLEAVQWRDGTPEPRLQQRHRGSVRMVDLLDELAELGPWDPRRQPTPP